MPPTSYEARVGFADFRTEQGVVEPALRFVDVEIGGHDVAVAGKDHRRTCRKQVGRMRREALEPAQLVVEFSPWSDLDGNVGPSRNGLLSKAAEGLHLIDQPMLLWRLRSPAFITVAIC